MVPETIHAEGRLGTDIEACQLPAAYVLEDDGKTGRMALCCRWTSR